MNPANLYQQVLHTATRRVLDLIDNYEAHGAEARQILLNMEFLLSR